MTDETTTVGEAQLERPGMVTLLDRVAEWLQRRVTREAVERLEAAATRIATGLAAWLERSAETYANGVARQKGARLAEARSAAGLHAADVPGLRSLGAPDELVRLAARGGRGRPRVPIYRIPHEVGIERMAAFCLLTGGRADVSREERRRAFELNPYRDQLVHAVVRGALDAAGPHERDAAFAVASRAFCTGAAKGMVGTSANSARTTYRRVERRARSEGRELATFRPIASDAFRIWMGTGRLPPSLDEPHDTGPGRGPSEH